MRTVCPTITKSAMQLVQKLFRHILNLSVLCICFDVCMGGIPASTYKFITVPLGRCVVKSRHFLQFSKGSGACITCRIRIYIT